MNRPINLILKAALAATWLCGEAYALAPPTNLRVGAPTTPPPTSGAKPTAANTGWQPTGVTLSPSGSITVTASGTVVDSKDISGTLTIQASNVTVKRCRVRSSSYYPIQVKDGYSNVVIQDTEVDGMGGSSKAILIGNSQVTVQRANIHDSEDGLSLNGSAGLTIVDNYVHNPRHSSEGHSDGFEMYGGAHMVIKHNNFDYSGANTSASNFSNWGGSINDVTYDGNWLAGGAYMLYVDGNFSGGPISNVKITNNRFVRGSSQYGTHVVRGNLSNITWSGNVYDDNGQAIGQ